MSKKSKRSRKPIYKWCASDGTIQKVEVLQEDMFGTQEDLTGDWLYIKEPDFSNPIMIQRKNLFDTEEKALVHYYEELQREINEEYLGLEPAFKRIRDLRNTQNRLIKDYKQRHNNKPPLRW